MYKKYNVYLKSPITICNDATENTQSKQSMNSYTNMDLRHVFECVFSMQSMTAIWQKLC